MISSRGLVDRKCHSRSPSDSEQFSGECVWTSRAGLVVVQFLGKSLMGQDLSQIYEIYH